MFFLLTNYSLMMSMKFYRWSNIPVCNLVENTNNSIKYVYILCKRKIITIFLISLVGHVLLYMYKKKITNIWYYSKYSNIV